MVSILALIFVEHPYFNEPGYTPHQGKPKYDKMSELYNDRVRNDTKRAAMKIPILFQPFFNMHTASKKRKKKSS